MILISVITIALLTIGQAFGEGDGTCPDKERIEPCICVNNTIICNKYEDIDLDSIFQEILGQFRPGENQFDLFELSNTVIEKLDDVFHGVYFKEIRLINNTKLSCIDLQAFRGMERFTLRFYATKTSLSQTGKSSCSIFDVLSGLNALQSIEITESDLIEIPDGAFHSKYGKQVDLNNITIANGEIKRVGKSAFAELNNLSSLDISHNKIDEIGPFAFAFTDQSNQPFMVNLENNSLSGSAFENDSLEVNGRVTTLNLIDNTNFDYLDENAFYPFLVNKPNGQNTVELAGCNLSVIPENVWLIDYKSVFDLTNKLRNATTDENRSIFSYPRKAFDKKVPTVPSTSSIPTKAPTTQTSTKPATKPTTTNPIKRAGCSTPVPASNN